MKTFHKQFCECEEEEMHKTGPVKKFKDHPELLPHPIIHLKAAKRVQKLLEKNPDVGLTTLLCLRFGGECSGANEECRKMRGL